MALEYNNNPVNKVIYKEQGSEQELMLLKCLSGSDYYDYVKPYTYTVNSSQWDWVSSVTWTRTKCYDESEKNHTTGTLTSSSSSFTVYYSDVFTLTIITKSGYHFGEASDNSKNSNTSTSLTITIDDTNSKTYSIPTIYKNKNEVKVSGTDYDTTNHKGHIKGVYLSTNPNEVKDTTNKSESGYFNYGDTVYAFYVLLDDGASSTPGTLVSTGVYRYASWTVAENESKDFGTISLSTSTYVVLFSNNTDKKMYWNDVTPISVYWGDTIEKRTADYTYGSFMYIYSGNYSSYNKITRQATYTSNDNSYIYRDFSVLGANEGTQTITRDYSITFDCTKLIKLVVYKHCSVTNSNYYKLYANTNLSISGAVDLTLNSTEFDINANQTGYILFGINQSLLKWSNGQNIEEKRTITINNTSISGQQATYYDWSIIDGITWIWYYFTVNGQHDENKQEKTVSWTQVNVSGIVEKNIGDSIIVSGGIEYDEDESSHIFFRITNLGDTTFIVNTLYLYPQSSGYPDVVREGISIPPGESWSYNGWRMSGYFYICGQWNGQTYYRPYGTGTYTYANGWGTQRPIDGAREPF